MSYAPAPLLSEKDEAESAEGGIDPLGLYTFADALGVRLVPGVRERQTHPRFLTATAVSLAVCGEFDEETLAADHSTEPWLVFEWYLVEGLVRSSESKEETRGLPGSQKAAKAKDEKVPLAAKRNLKSPAIFGFHGIYRLLARTLGVETKSGSRLGEAGAELLSVWSKEQGLDGFIGTAGGLGQLLRRQWQDAVRDGLQNASTAKSPRSGWNAFREHLGIYNAGPNEKQFITKLLGGGEIGFRREVLDFLVSPCGREVWQAPVSERRFHEALRGGATDDLWQLHMIDSSNFTSAGLGIGRVKNVEANLVYLVNSQATDAWKILQNAWLPTEPIPNDVERQWQIPNDNCDDAPTDTLPLPVAFADATFGRDANGASDADASKGYLVLTFVGTPPPGWTLFAEDEIEPLFSETDWQARDCPSTLKLPWLRPRPPYAIRVQLGESGGSAWWPVNVENSDTLPPPDELKDLSLELLIEILTSAKPLHEVLRGRTKRKGKDDGQRRDAGALDPLDRVDSSAFLLQRTRRVSWALAALRKRLEEQPIVSEQSLAWRLRGPVGVLALAQAITNDAKESRSDAEQCFLLTELCAELARIRPSTTADSLPAARVRAALREIVGEIRAGISFQALDADPAMAEYVDTVFQEVVK